MFYKQVVFVSLSAFVIGKGSSNVLLNGVEYDVNKAAESDSFDYYVTYPFSDGIPLNFSCQDSGYGSLITLVTNALGFEIKIEKTVYPYDNSSYLYMKLQAASNGSYIDCRVTRNEVGAKSNVTRINLVPGKKPDYGFRANGLTSPLTKCQDLVKCYMYSYYEGEEVTVKSFINDKMFENMSCDIRNHGKYARLINFSEITKTIELMYCNVDGLSNHSIALRAQLATTFPLVIKGLTMAKTLAMFLRNATTLEIVYEWDDNDILPVQCVSNAPTKLQEVTRRSNGDNIFPIWKNYDSRVDISNVHSVKDYNKLNTNGEFKLKASYETGVVSCILSDGEMGSEVVVMITLARANRDSDIRKLDAFNEESNDSTAVDDGKADVKGINNNIVIGVSVGALLVIIFISSMFITILKRKSKTGTPDTNINYEGLPEHNKGPMLVPSQWQEPQYSNPDDFIINSDYAVPNPPTLKDMYAEAIPKNQRNQLKNYNPAKVSTKRSPQGAANEFCKNITSGNILDNGELNHSQSDKRQFANIKRNLLIINERNCSIADFDSENAYVEINGSECSYAQINENVHAEPNNKQTPNYVNVFEKHSYVNSEAKNDHIEAAYCEMFS